MESKQVEVLTKAQFETLGEAEQIRLMESWRDQYTNKEIFEAMGYTSHQYYKLIGKLGVKAKDNAPSTTKLRNNDDKDIKQEANLISQNEVQEEVEETANQTETKELQTINISISDCVDREKAELLFQSVLAFLATGGEYNLSIVVSK